MTIEELQDLMWDEVMAFAKHNRLSDEVLAEVGFNCEVLPWLERQEDSSLLRRALVATKAYLVEA